MGKYLQALKLIYGDGENNYEPLEQGTDKTDNSPIDISDVGNVSSTFAHIKRISSHKDTISITNHELAEHKVAQLMLRDDQIFLRRCLVGIYGSKRLEIVNQYFEEWQRGREIEVSSIRKENAGRRRANTWIRERMENKARKIYQNE